MSEKSQDKNLKPPASDTTKGEASSTDRPGNKPSTPTKTLKPAGAAIDIFVLSRIFPDPASVFTRKPVSLDLAWKDCLFVIDTNVLLLPYRAGTESLKKIGEIYRTLIKAGRLFIPARVAQEFASNRSERLKEVHQQLNLHQSSIQIPGALSLQFLADLPEYATVAKANAELHKGAKAYRDAISSLRSIIEGWAWNDPVSALYSELFQKSVVVDGTPHPDEVASDLEYRWSHKVPPGYKDSSKDDNGVGDLLIWHSILALARSQGKHLVFISGEEKPDWCVVSNKSGLYPRFELVDEYSRASGDKSFFLLQFSDFLKRQGASAKVVEEIRKEEVTANSEQHRRARPNRPGIFDLAVRAVAKSLSASLDGTVSKKASGDFDFIIDTTIGDRLACDVRVVGSESNVKTRVLNMIHRHQQNTAPSGTTPLLVLVAVDEETLRFSQQAIEFADTTFATPPILGLLDGERFVPA